MTISELTKLLSLFVFIYANISVEESVFKITPRLASKTIPLIKTGSS
jgi:hypothetical protein